MDTALSPPVGQLLGGRYHVGSRIARGGMATVYLGTDTRLDRVIALKIAHPELSDDAEFVRRFIGEARSAARLSSPNVVGIYDQGSDRRLHYIAMEYVPGRTLRQLLNERGRLSPDEALDIMTGVLSGLAAAHQAGLAHRDVKPENVLLTSTGGVKVADFGLARSVAGAVQTKGGMIIGTAAYLAPEQVSGGKSDARTDVYAAGILLFELLTGTQPHTGDSPLNVAYKHVNEIVPPPSSVLPGLAPALDALVAMATSRDPELRPAHAGQFLRAIQEVRNGRGLPASAPYQAPGQSAPYGGPAGAPQPASHPYGGQERGYEPARYDSGGYPQPHDRGAVGASALPSLSPQSAALAPGNVPGRPGDQQGAINHTLIVPAGVPLDDYGAPTGPNSARYPGGGYPYDGGYSGHRYAGRRARRQRSEPWLQHLLFSRRLAYLSGGLVVILLLALGGWWLSAGQFSKVPRLGGVALSAARSELAGLSLNLRVGKQEHDLLPKGDIITSSPAGGSRLTHGSWVTVTVSLGPVMIQVPDVTGQPLAQAQAALTAAHLIPGTVTSAASDSVPAGNVIATTPPAYTSWPQSKPVGLTVSAGPGLPDFVGMQLSDAQAAAQQGGYTIQQVTDPKGSQPANTITSQSPQPNTPITPGEVVIVHVSPGPPGVPVPDVTGMKVDKATHILQAAGFQVSINSGLGNTVLSYSPTGTQPQGSTITLNVGLFSGF